jgi:hypothetical protein
MHDSGVGEVADKTWRTKEKRYRIHKLGNVYFSYIALALVNLNGIDG